MANVELTIRAKKIKIVFSDCDGVLTDTGVYYSQWGESLKKFSIRDGMGVELLRHAGIDCGIITGEKSSSLQRRAEKLEIEHLYLGVKNKYEFVSAFSRQQRIDLDEIAFIGDDVNDYELISILSKGSLTAAPSDAVPVIQKEANYICQAAGGHGAFREFVDWLLELRGYRINDYTNENFEMLNPHQL